MLYQLLSPPKEHKKGHRSILRKGPTNIFESENDWSLEMLAPGFQKSDIKMNIDDNTLTISSPAQEETKSPFRREYHPLEINRSFKLPKNIDVENINAELDAGILKIIIPKSEEAKSRTINIK